MMRSCSYCGKIHDSKFICEQKQKAQELRQAGHTARDSFRWSRAWKKKTADIKKRDKYMCQCCLRKYPGTVYQYCYDRLEVHHIIPIVENSKKKMNDKNLITLCRYHHEMAEKGEIPRKNLIQIVLEQEGKREHENNSTAYYA